MTTSAVGDRQAPLRAAYKSSPESAMVTDHAIAAGADAADPFHSAVQPMPESGVKVPVGVHRAVGGLHDAPTPGDMLCAALAACQDSTIRLVANLMGVEIEALCVEVTADVDVRGTLGVERDVPVGFQSIRCNVTLKAGEGTPERLLKRLGIAAERCCVVQQTLKSPPPVETRFELS